MAGAWVIGEYGDALLRGGQYEEEELVQEVTESDLVDLFSTILSSSYATQIVSEYLITALMKLTTRLSDPGQVDRVRRLLITHSTSLDVEIQQRAVEYGNLFGYDQIRRGVLEKMPPPEIREEQRVFGEATPKRKSVIHGRKAKTVKTTESDLLDLMGGADLPASQSPALNGSQNNADLLADILGGTSPAASPASSQQNANVNSIMDLFGSSNTAAAAAPTQSYSSPSADLFGGVSSPPPQASTPQASSAAQYSIYSKNDLSIVLSLQRNAGVVQIIAKFRNGSNFDRIDSLNLQAAVPKTQKLQLHAISSAELDSGMEATQMMRVTGSQGVSHFLSYLVVFSCRADTAIAAS